MLDHYIKKKSGQLLNQNKDEPKQKPTSIWAMDKHDHYRT